MGSGIKTGVENNDDTSMVRHGKMVVRSTDYRFSWV